MLKSCHTIGVIEAGTDEAGRGCIAGPVYAAAVILPADYHNPHLNDSKQLSKHTREHLRETIVKEAIAYSVAWLGPEEIDQINILRASITCMHKALDGLRTTPEHLIIDGNRFYPYKDIPHTCIVKGDALYASIAAASILAKTFRDDHMTTLAKDFPQYGWEKNFGYPTTAHREAIRKFGPTPHHRLTFKLLPDPTLF